MNNEKGNVKLYRTNVSMFKKDEEEEEKKKKKKSVEVC